MPKNNNNNPVAGYEVSDVCEIKLNTARESAVRHAAEHVVNIVDAIAGKAKSGDVQAARLIFEICGLVRRPGFSVAIQQNNISQQPKQDVITLGDIIDITPDGKIIEKQL